MSKMSRYLLSRRMNQEREMRQGQMEMEMRQGTQNRKFGFGYDGMDNRSGGYESEYRARRGGGSRNGGYDPYEYEQEMRNRRGNY